MDFPTECFDGAPKFQINPKHPGHKFCANGQQITKFNQNQKWAPYNVKKNQMGSTYPKPTGTKNGRQTLVNKIKWSNQVR